MRGCRDICRVAAVAVLCTVLAHAALATGVEPREVRTDFDACIAAAAAGDDDKVIAICGAVIDNQKAERTDRVKALLARAAAGERKGTIDRAIADYDGALRFDPTLADAFNARGELWRRKGDRPRALQDFGAAIRLNPEHPAAKANYKSLAKELERLGALMGVYSRPGFNCATTRQAVEKFICANPELAHLEREINAVNAKVVSSARRNAAFGQPDYDLHKAMTERLERLLAIESR
jgi:tetratricopeptide (TPR) repeat protein